MSHDVFLSYRRDGGEHLAGRVKDALKSRGLSVFMDVEDLKSGKFDVALLREIEEATDVVVILTPGCLDRCRNEDDWLRQEIRHSIQSGKNIVPILARGFQMPSFETLPSDIAELVRYHGLTPAPELFEASIDRLVSKFLLSKPQTNETLRSSNPDSPSGDTVDVMINAQLENCDDAIVDFDTLPNGQGLVLCYPHEVHLTPHWPHAGTEGRIRCEDAEATSCAVSEDGNLLALGCGCDSISIYQLRDGKKITTLRRPAFEDERQLVDKLGVEQDSYEYRRLTFSPDGRYLAACRQIPDNEQAKLPSGWTVEAMDDCVDVFGLDGHFRYRLPGYGSSPIACFSLDSQYIVVGLEVDGTQGVEGNNLETYHIENGRKAYSKALAGYVRCVIAHPDRKQAIVSLSCSDSRAIRFLSLTSGMERSALSYNAIPDNGRYPCTDAVCIDGKGQYLASGHNRGVLRLWDTRRHILLRTWLSNPHGQWVRKLKFSGNGEFLFASLYNFDDGSTSDQLAVVRVSNLLMDAAPK